MKRIHLLYIISIILISSCMPFEERKITNVQLDFSDKELQRLIDFQDRRLTDSLLPYANSKNPTYRYSTAIALGSSKDKDGLVALYDLLEDDVDEVRAASAFAIGQIGDSSSVAVLVAAFDADDSLRIHTLSNGQILEAVGKCGNQRHLDLMASIKSYNESDTLLLLGQTRSLYRFGIRGITSDMGTKKMISYTTNPKLPEEVRLMAAHYLHRSKGIQVDSSALKIASNIQKEKNPNIRMAQTTGLAKSRFGFARDTLLKVMQFDEDYRVRCNSIRAMSFFPYYEVRDTIINLLQDMNEMVSYSAADYFFHNGVPEDAKSYRIIARNIKDWRTRTRMYAAANKNLSYYFTQTKSAMTNELTQLFNSSENIYEKAAILDAMSYFQWTYPQLKTLGFDSKNPVLMTAAVQGWGNILGSKDFDNVFQLGKRRVGNEIRTNILEAAKSKDAGSIALAAELISNPEMGFKEYFSEGGFLVLDTIQNNLELPKEMETHLALQKAIDYLRGKAKKTQGKPDFNHPIDWELVEALNHRVRGIIQTNKGKIVLEFFHQEAPATVANFIQLTRDGYYDDKVIHRVVPNFVMQGGCNRGDGYGSEDFSIRSEFNPYLNYNDEGYIGMASAGNDTEATQWFISHSPTPHLDGNYTIFGKVKDGMEVVHSIQMGDKVEKANIRF